MHILTFPKDTDKLRVVGQPVTPEMIKSDEFKEKLAQMIEIAKKDGIGLAATQVDWPVQLFVLLVDRNLVRIEEPYVVINPKIISESDERAPAPEGCLSFPGLGINPTRPKRITWSWQTLDGESHQTNEEYVRGTYWGFFVRVIQHETDHLNGKLMVDHITKQEQSLYEKWLRKQ